MRSEVFFAVFTAFLHTASAARAPPKPAPGSRPASDDVIPGRFIVEFQDQSGLAKRDPNGDVSHSEDLFAESMQMINPPCLNSILSNSSVN